MEDQQKLQQILAQLEVYKSQTELYQTQIDAVQTSLAEIKILESTLDDISGKDTVETLVPLGAGSFINAEIKNENKVIMSLGSGVAVSKTFEEAKVTAAEQKQELETKGQSDEREGPEAKECRWPLQGRKGSRYTPEASRRQTCQHLEF